MLPGPILIRKCYHCGHLFKLDVITFGEKLWGDSVVEVSKEKHYK